MSLVARAQKTSLLGVHDLPEHELPYEALGEDRQPYDLNDAVAITQLKAALAALGAYWSDRLARLDPATETRWQHIDVATAAWEPAAADEFAFAVGRLRGAGWQVSGPYAVETPVGPQPTATGLELVAGAVNQLLGGTPRMTHYETWRGGVFAPPSLISGPSPSDPVTAQYFYGAGFKLPPAQVQGGVASGLQLVREALTTAWSDAMLEGQPEAYRASIEKRILEMRSERDKLVEIAIANAPPREGQTVVEHVAQAECLKIGGIWDPSAGSCAITEKQKAESGGTNYAPWILLALGAAGVGYALWKSRQPSYGFARRNNRG
jgi:hypothetical protein